MRRPLRNGTLNSPGVSINVGVRYSTVCYESPKKEIVSCAFEHLIYNIKSYNGVKI